MSKSSVSTASRSERRRFSAARVIATKLTPAEAPMTRAQGACGTRMPRIASAKTTVVDWPRTASQRSRISVRSRIQALRASTARGGRLVSDMAAG